MARTRSVTTLAMLVVCMQLPAAWALDAQTITSTQLVAVATRALQLRLEGPSPATLQVIGRPDAVTLPAGVVRLQAQPITGKLPRARVGVAVCVYLGTRCAQTAVVWFAVTDIRRVETYAARAPWHAKGSTLHLQLAEVDIASLNGPPTTAPPDLHHERLRHAVNAGDAVLHSDFEPIPDVDAQQRVRVSVVEGAVHIHAMGTALAAGMKGAEVPVVLAGQDKPFDAIVTGQGAVDVQQ